MTMFTVRGELVADRPFVGVATVHDLVHDLYVMDEYGLCTLCGETRWRDHRSPQGLFERDFAVLQGTEVLETIDCMLCLWLAWSTYSR